MYPLIIFRDFIYHSHLLCTLKNACFNLLLFASGAYKNIQSCYLWMLIWTISNLYVDICVNVYFVSIATTTPPAPTKVSQSCIYNGEVYPLGHNIWKTDCMMCTCFSRNRQKPNWSCMINDCQQPKCSNPVKISGQCCPVCPGKLLSAKKQLKVCHFRNFCDCILQSLQTIYILTYFIFPTENKLFKLKIILLLGLFQ